MSDSVPGNDRPQDRPRGRASVPSSRPAGPGAARPTSAGSTGAGRAGSAGRAGGTYGSGAKVRRARPRWGRIVLVLALVLILCGGLGLGGAWMYARSVDSDLARTDPFSTLTEGRPPKTVDGSQNILLVGSDSRDPDAATDKGSEWRADTIIIMHIPSSQDRAYIISLPRDLYVYVPQNASAKECGTRRAKINAAYAFGGLPLTVKTVECLTSVRIDHVMAIDFGGFTEVVDAVGGVDMPIERTVQSIHQPFRTFTQGTMHLDGAAALDYVRQRKQFPDGDFARMRHQQQFLKVLLDKAASSETLTSPLKLRSFLDAVTGAVTVDEQFSLIDMALQFRSVRSDQLTFITSPNLGSDTINGESVVVSDKPKALALYKAVAGDTMAAWVASNQSPAPTN
jgi:LCP family protein required for cell wall assembly